jgi:hypothetical protein
MRKTYFTAVFLAGAALSVAGCAIEPAPKPVMSYERMAPMFVNVAHVDIVDSYRQGGDPNDVASSYPVPPLEALHRYIGRRFQGTAPTDSLKFDIQDASVRHNVIQPDNKIGQWAGIGVQDEYEISIRMHIYSLTDMGAPKENATLAFKRSISIAASASPAEHERRQLEFLDGFLTNIDKTLSDAMRSRMHLAGAGQ